MSAREPIGTETGAEARIRLPTSAPAMPGVRSEALAIAEFRRVAYHLPESPAA